MESFKPSSLFIILRNILMFYWMANVDIIVFAKKVLVIGAGPAGLLSCKCLLGRGKDYDINLFEYREDPRKTAAGPRAYSLGLNIRGQTAVKHFDRGSGLWSRIKANGVESDSFFLHIGAIKLQIRRPKKESVKSVVPPTLMIPRDILSGTILSILEDTYLTNGRFKANFNSRLEHIDVDRRVAVINGQEIKYDLLIGADGVSSSVRQCLVNSSSSSQSPLMAETATLPGQYKVMVQPLPHALEERSIHLMESTKKPNPGYSLFLIPAPGNDTCVLVSWRSEKPPEPLTWGDSAAANERLKLNISLSFPLFGRPTDEALAQLHSQKPSVALSVRCNRYHDSRAAALLLGDAAHSTGGVLGQGANSALMDVVALDKCLDECDDDITKALPLFSERQVPEGLSLWKLLQLPPKKSGLRKMAYQIIQTLRGLLSGIFPFIKPPIQTLLSQSLTPFSAIAKCCEFWIKPEISDLQKFEFCGDV